MADMLGKKIEFLKQKIVIWAILDRSMTLFFLVWVFAYPLTRHQIVRKSMYYPLLRLEQRPSLIYIWVTLVVHNILASRREQNHIRNRTSAHLKEKNILFLIYFPIYGPVKKFLQKSSPESLLQNSKKYSKQVILDSKSEIL